MNARAAHTMPARVKLTVDAYFLLDRAGALAEVRRTELIDGDILPMTPRSRDHSRAQTTLAQGFRDGLSASGSPLGVLAGVTAAMLPHDAPDPDIVVTSEPRGDGPVPLASVALLVEVSDTTIDFDLATKAALYARHGVPEYWVVDLTAARLIRMWRPQPDGYASTDATPFGTPVAAVTIPGLVVATDQLD